MADLIHEHSTVIEGEDGRAYRARIYGQERRDGTWNGWIEFITTDAAGATETLRTAQETSQPDRKAVDYWAGGLERVYLEGALQRALNNGVRATSRMGTSCE